MAKQTILGGWFSAGLGLVSPRPCLSRVFPLAFLWTPHLPGRTQTHTFLVRRSSCAIHTALHFLRGHTALAQGEKEFVPRIRLHSFPYRLTCRC